MGRNKNNKRNTREIANIPYKLLNYKEKKVNNIHHL